MITAAYSQVSRAHFTHNAGETRKRQKRWEKILLVDVRCTVEKGCKQWIKIKE